MANKGLHDFQQDLIEDISFIAWVQSEFEIDNDKWSDFVDAHIDQMDEINQAIRFVRSLEFKQDGGLDKSSLWKKIEKSTATQNPQIVIMNPWKMVGVAVAAAIGLLFYFIPITLDTSLETYRAEIASTVTEAFPDGSAVTLNPGSEVTFDGKNWEQNRKVKLRGLAFFKVRKGSTFVVETEKGSITVLGTSFSVDARDQRFEVICKTGKVSVKSNSGEEVVLESGGVATSVLDKLLVQTRPEGAVGLVSWLDGNFTFSDISFAEVIKEIENQFPVRVHMDQEFYKMKYTGYFKNDNLNDALFSITWPLKLKYSIKGSDVFIVKE